MYQWLWSKFYDKMIKDAEEKGLSDWRQTLLQNISGDVLEIGCGTGANINFYPAAVNRLVLLEPSKHMIGKLKEKYQHKLANAEILNHPAENILLPDNSFDYVVCTLVLCSVNNLEKSLAEIYRLLKPQGKFIFIEHVAATNNPQRLRWQHRLNFVWKHLMDGCHTTRSTEEVILKTGFNIQEIQRQSMRGVPPIVRPSIRGVAVKM